MAIDQTTFFASQIWSRHKVYQWKILFLLSCYICCQRQWNQPSCGTLPCNLFSIVQDEHADDSSLYFVLSVVLHSRHVIEMKMVFDLVLLSLVAQIVKNLPAMQQTWVPSLDQEDALEEGMATHSNIRARRIPMDRGAWWTTVHGVTELDMTEPLKHTGGKY